MLEVSGYKIGDRIHHTPHSEVYAGTRLANGLKVVLKIYPPTDSKVSRAQREFELLSRIDTPGVVKAIEVLQLADRSVLVVERFAGYALSGYTKRKLDLRAFLSVALQVTEALAGVHEARIVHKDIKLGNILLDPHRMRTCLIDFGIAAEFGRAESASRTSLPEGTLRYIAPEQTGRLGLGVDFRTDLYSLGVCFYELLTGRPPFNARDEMELIHAHIALRPQPAVEVSPGLPSALSRIADKLMEKDPERRYQTAWGLHADLTRCLEQLTSQGEIAADLPLGTQDASDRLRFGQELVGRTEEIAQLRAAFERAARKRVELVLLSGPAGIGKSSLPGVLRQRLGETGGYLASGKFDRGGRDRPYAGFGAALTSLVDQVLAERGERLEAWGLQIEKELGAIGAELLQLAPNLEYVVDNLEPTPPLAASEARERLALAVCRFVRVFAQPSHPLVLVLDDLQWADPGSLFLLEALLRASEPQALLVIGSYRDNEVGAGHPLLDVLKQVESAGVRPQILTLSALSLDDINEIVAATLARDPSETAWLSRRISLKSENNPLLVRRLLLHLWERDLIRYQHGSGWVWDERQLIEAQITDDAAAMMVHKIHGLASGARELLKLASLVGDVFDVERLAELSDGDRLDLLQQLMTLTEAGFVAPCREGFKFVHDRLREAAQTLVGEQERVELHHRMAQLLLARTPAASWAERAIEIADHLNQALAVLSEREREHAITINLSAGRRSLASGSAITAARYLELGRALFRESDWEREPEESFGLFIESAEAAYQLRQFDRVEQLLDPVKARPLTDAQRSEVVARRINVLTLTRSDEALDLTLATLRELGLRWPKQPSWLRVRLTILLTDWFLRGRIEQRRFAEARPDDTRRITRARIISAGGSSIHLHSFGLMCIATSYLLTSYARHGAVRSPGLALTGYASYRIRFLRDLRHAERYAGAAEVWLQQRPNPRSQFHLAAFLYAWSRPRLRVAADLREAAVRLGEIGDIEYRGFCIQESCSYLVSSGEPLDAVIGQLEAFLPERSLGGAAFLDHYLHMYRLLQRGAADAFDQPDELKTNWMDPAGGTQQLVSLHWSTVLCICGKFARAAEHADAAAQQLLARGSPTAYLADLLMFRGLAHAVLASAEHGAERRRRSQVVRWCLRQLARWSRHAPDVVHMEQILSAEWLRLKGGRTNVLRAYQDGARRARERGFRQHAALAHERRADLLRQMRRETEGAQALEQALELYREWGAHGKVRLIKARQGHSSYPERGDE